jgi:hypothetical protein
MRWARLPWHSEPGACAASVVAVLALAAACGGTGTPTGSVATASSKSADSSGSQSGKLPAHSDQAITVSGAFKSQANGSMQQAIADCRDQQDAQVLYSDNQGISGYELNVGVPAPQYGEPTSMHFAFPGDADKAYIPELYWFPGDGSSYVWGGGGSGANQGSSPSTSSGSLDITWSDSSANAHLVAGKVSMTLGPPNSDLAQQVQGAQLATGSVRVTASWTNCVTSGDLPVPTTPPAGAADPCKLVTLQEASALASSTFTNCSLGNAPFPGIGGTAVVGTAYGWPPSATTANVLMVWSGEVRPLEPSSATPATPLSAARLVESITNQLLGNGSSGGVTAIEISSVIGADDAAEAAATGTNAGTQQNVSVSAVAVFKGKFFFLITDLGQNQPSASIASLEAQAKISYARML